MVKVKGNQCGKISVNVSIIKIKEDVQNKEVSGNISSKMIHNKSDDHSQGRFKFTITSFWTHKLGLNSHNLSNSVSQF